MKKENKLNILALDIATTTGWAVSNSIYGTWKLKPPRDASIGMRLLTFNVKVREMIALAEIDLVVFERPGGRFAGAIIVQSELQGILKEYCEEQKIPYRAYSSREIKLYATGKGNCSKAAMIAAAKEKLGYTGDSDDEADAIWLLNLAESEYNKF